MTFILWRGVVYFNFIFESIHFKLIAKAKKIRTLFIPRAYCVYMHMKENIKTVQIVQQIDSKFIVELYKKAKKEKGEKRQKLVEQAFLLSKHIGKYLTIKV